MAGREVYDAVVSVKKMKTSCADSSSRICFHIQGRWMSCALGSDIQSNGDFMEELARRIYVALESRGLGMVASSYSELKNQRILVTTPRATYRDEIDTHYYFPIELSVLEKIVEELKIFGLNVELFNGRANGPARN